MRINNRLEITMAIGLSIAFISSCNQVDPEETEDTDTVDHPPWVWQCEESGNNQDADPADLYPMVDNAKWSFHRYGGLEHIGNDILVLDQDSWENLTMTQVTYEGGTAFMIEDSPNVNNKVTQNWHVASGNSVFRAHKEEFKDYDPDTILLSIDYYLGATQSQVSGIDEYLDGFKRFDFDWMDKTEGWSEVLAYNRMVNIDQTGNNGTIGEESVRVHEFTVEATDETVVVPAGTFEHCMKVKRARLREPDSNASEAETRADIKRSWFCPGIGKVKEQEVNDDPRTEELLYYCIPGGLCC